eukprot:GHVO01027988.1.p1 GENE.GHVO01027988.1~~GHVO01027988.1.p1  ORF type:complete len:441 (+),score=18.77 GHVO01027988.1:48-1370(+)
MSLLNKTGFLILLSISVLIVCYQSFTRFTSRWSYSKIPMNVSVNVPPCGDMLWYTRTIELHAQQLAGSGESFESLLWDFNPQYGAINGIGDRIIGIAVLFFHSIMASKTLLLTTTDPSLQDVLWPKNIFWNVSRIKEFLPMEKTSPPMYTEEVLRYIREVLPFQEVTHVDWKDTAKADLILYNRSITDNGPGGIRLRYFQYPNKPEMTRTAMIGWNHTMPDSVMDVINSFQTLSPAHYYGCAFHALFRPSVTTVRRIAEGLYDIAIQCNFFSLEVPIDTVLDMNGLEEFFQTRYGVLGLPSPRMDEALAVAFPSIHKNDIPHFISFHIRTANAKGVSFRDNTHRSPPNVYIEMMECGRSWTDARPGQRTKMLLASDNGYVKKRAALEYPDHIVTLKSTASPKHIVFSKNIDAQKVSIFTEHNSLQYVVHANNSKSGRVFV